MCLALQFVSASPHSDLHAGNFAAKRARRVVTNAAGRTEPSLCTAMSRASLLGLLFCGFFFKKIKHLKLPGVSWAAFSSVSP